jgi:hypothetical protein
MRWKWGYFSEEHIASIFKAEVWAEQEASLNESGMQIPNGFWNYECCAPIFGKLNKLCFTAH